MARDSQDIYGTYGSVPNETPVNGSGAQPNQTRANAEEFGGNIGKGLENVGQAGEQVANQFGGLIMETAANQAELGYIKASGDLKAKYSQYEGLQAEAMRPQYESELSTLHNQYRQNLPILAQKQFDSNTIRSLGNQTSEYAGYAASQVKSANLQSNDALADNAISQAGNLPAVTDPAQFGGLMGRVIHSSNAVADIKGWSAQATGTDPDTGRLTFGDSPEAKATQAQYEQYTNAKLSNLYMTAAKTVADNRGASAAADWAQAHWNMMPDAAKVQMNQYLAPKVKNETIGNNIANMTNQADAGYSQQVLSKVPGSPTQSVVPQNDISDVIHQQESGGKPHDYQIQPDTFKQYAKPGESFDSPKDQDAVYGRIITDLKQAYPNDPQRQAVAYFSGKGNVAPAGNPAPWLNNTQDKNGKTVSSYVADINSKIQSPSVQSTYPNKAEYLRGNEESLVQNSVNNYLKQYPDDYYGSQIQERRARTEIKHQISTEDNRLKSDRDSVDNAIGGALTKGNPPATYAELKAIPGMQPVLDRAHSEQGDYSSTIDTRIAKATHRDALTNTPNAYDAVQASLDTSENWTRQASIEYLSKGLGSDNPGYSISQKDFNDAKAGVDLSPSMKQTLSKTMKDITSANGNVDGQGQQRAVDWYNRAVDSWKQNSARGEKAMPEDEFLQNNLPVPAPPSRMQQIASASQAKQGNNSTPPQAAIAMLKSKPELAGAFKEKYGLDPQQYLGQ